ncbi:PP2C family protein-serine/threonine phosphatase [Streptomyces sp. JJ36]|uniref:PP2C family protein-serine/threonine phosphatase n=1 Tax=Streptomyces sp. JJ36 TaxID=2736645 RepID=UPI001F026D18|nr:SpoIIE family protein phosphatase [Streptomyces sp. JJ36]MCF6525429.1 SpoIIE family protein phosphatase [Streptomyces sp. JJ36]
MPSPFPADRADGASPSERGTLDALLTQARRLRGGIDAMRRGTAEEDDADAGDPHRRWQRALCELAVHHLDDLGGQLSQLRDGVPAEPPGRAGAAPDEHGPAAYGPAAPGPAAEGAGSLVGRVGSADWNLLTDEVTWSGELYAIFGRTAADGPLSLDELPSWVWEEDQPRLTAAVTDCLVDGRPVDGRFRIVRPDGGVRSVHMMGEPVLDAEGGTASMWAVVRDVSELRRSERAVRESRDTLQRQRYRDRTERRLAVEMQEAVLPPWRGSRRLPHRSGTEAGWLDLAAHYLPSATAALVGGDWYDALELPGGATLLTVGDLTGHGVAATSGMAQLLGALRGMSVAGVEPGPLLGHLNQLLDSAAQPALGSALCCCYEPGSRALTWSQAGHPVPLLFRDGVGRPLPAPEGVLLGATSGASYGQRTEQLEPGDLLLLHTDGLAPRSTEFELPRPGATGGADRLLALAPRFATARTAQECVRAVVEEFGDRDREDDACVLIARVAG